jgi:hypothetical protein
MHVYRRPTPILGSADPRAWREEGVADPQAQSAFAVVLEVILTYESAPDATPCLIMSNDCGQPVLGARP